MRHQYAYNAVIIARVDRGLATAATTRNTPAPATNVNGSNGVTSKRKESRSWPIAFPRLVGREDAEPFAEMARREFGVGVVPGSFFGASANFRIAVSGQTRAVEDGLEALGKALDKGWS